MKKLIAPLMSLALTGSLFTACYVADTELEFAGAGDNLSMTVGWTSNGVLTETNKPYAFVAYIDETSMFQLKESRKDTASYTARNYNVSIGIKSTTPPGLSTSVIQGKGHWNLLISDTNVTVQNPDNAAGIPLSSYDSVRHAPAVIPGISRQASIGARNDNSIVVLGRKILTESGVARSESSPGLVLITAKPVEGERSYNGYHDLAMQPVSTRDLGSVTSVNPLLVLDLSSTAYVASWKNSESEDVSALFVDAAGKEKSLDHAQPGSPKAAWTDGKSFKIASVDNQGMSYVFDGANLVDGPKVSGALCSAFDFGDNGILSILTVSDQAVTLTQLGSGATPTSIQVAGALDSKNEVSRTKLCALSHTGLRTNVAWQGTQSPNGSGTDATFGTLYFGLEGGQVVAFHRFADGPAQKVKFKIALPDAGVGRVKISYTPVAINSVSSEYCYHSQYPKQEYYANKLCEEVEFETTVGATVSLTAEAYTDGSSFRGWSGVKQFGSGAPLCQDGSLTCQFTIFHSTTVGAEFKGPPLSIGTVGSTGPGGRITSQPAGINCTTNGTSGTCSKSFSVGTQVVLTAVPLEYTGFLGWGGAPGCDDASLSCTVTITNEPLTVTPQFSHITKTVTIAKSGTGTGAVTSAADYNYTAISCGTECIVQVRKSAPRSLVASAAPGSQFMGWTNCPYVSPYSDGRTCEVSYSENNTAPAPLTVTANFNDIP